MSNFILSVLVTISIIALGSPEQLQSVKPGLILCLVLSALIDGIRCWWSAIE